MGVDTLEKVQTFGAFKKNPLILWLLRVAFNFLDTGRIVCLGFAAETEMSREYGF